MMGALPASLARRLRRAAESARRRKLRSAGAAQHALPDLEGAKGAARHVAIIGAGLSGLCAAHLLRQAGQRVTVLEARDQPGGRTLTLREGFADGLYADAGAARIADIHSRALAWIEHFGLSLEPMYPDRGHLISEQDGRPVLGADLARLSSHDIHHVLTGHMPWEAQWSASRSIRLLVRNSFVKPVWYRIKGGMDYLPCAFADRLEGAIRYGAAVTTINQDSAGVDVHYSRASGVEQRLRADFVVCAAPYTALRAIRISPALPADKRRIIDQSRSESATRIFLQVRDRAWLSPHWSGYGVTPDKWEIWQSNFASTPRCLFTVYVQGKAAVPFAALAPEARIATATARLEGLFPGIRDNCETALQVCWDENPWSFGAQQVGELPLDVGTNVEGRLHFAGSHTSASGWMEGALESGYRVATEILGRGSG